MNLLASALGEKMGQSGVTLDSPEKVSIGGGTAPVLAWG